MLLGATIDIAVDNPGGIGTGRTLDYLGMDPHNGYAKVLAEGGILAFGLLLAALLWSAAYSARLIGSSANTGPIAAFALCSVSALSGQALVESAFWFFFSFVSLPAVEVRDSAGSINLREREAR